jgi:methylase of polypeptide subunit release factors
MSSFGVFTGNSSRHGGPLYVSRKLTIKWFVLMIGKVYKKVLDILRSNNAVTHWVWGVPIRQKVIPWTWDVTTLVLKRVLDDSLPAGHFNYLDMGCGHVGLLGQYVKRRRPDATVVSVDYYPEFAKNAGANIQANGLDIDVRQSDLFSTVGERFDLITTNLPYKPEKLAQNGIEWPATTFSGSDGGDTTRRFLAEAHQHLTSRGMVFLGINCFFLPEAMAREIITKAGWSVAQTVRRRFNTARVFVIRSNETAA